MNQDIAMGLKISGNYLGNSYGLRVDKDASIGGKVKSDGAAGNFQFANSSYSETIGDYTKTADGTTLEDLIRDCLKAAADARNAAKAAHDRADSAYTRAEQAETNAKNASRPNN